MKNASFQIQFRNGEEEPWSNYGDIIKSESSAKKEAKEIASPFVEARLEYPQIRIIKTTTETEILPFP